MKKVILSIMILTLMTAPLFASGNQGVYSKLGACYKAADANCSMYGDVWNPNDKGWTVDGVFIPNTYYNPNKISIDRAGLAACQGPLYASCKSQYPA